MTHYNLNNLRFYCLAFVFVSVLIFSAAKIDTVYKFHKPVISKENSVVNFTPKFYQTFTLGYSRLVSSILWVSTLLESDTEHYQGPGNSWMYFRFLTISNLEPRFYLNYLYGGQYLSIAKDDVYGADTIYKKGLNSYPKDFWLSYHGGFNAAFEIGDYSLALEYYNNIYDHPDVQEKYPSLLSIINKLRLDSGELNLQQVYELIHISWIDAKDEDVKKLLGRYLYDIKAELDLTCLNSSPSKSSCSKTDFDGNFYLRDNENYWSAQQNWKPYRLHKKKAPQSEGQ